MFSPAIDGVAPGVSAGWKPGNNLKAMGSRVEAVNSIVLAAARPIDGFYLSVMKHALLHVEPTTWTPDEVVDGVVAIFAPESVQENGFLIGLAVMIGILEED